MTKTGFNQTELGLIPEDWEIEAFGKAFRFLRNNTLPRACLCEAGIISDIHYGDVLIRYGNVLDFDKETPPCIVAEFSSQSIGDYLQDGDLIIADTAEDETVGKSIEISNLHSRKAVAGLHTMLCRPKRGFAPGWLGYFVNFSRFHDQLIPLICGAKVSSISKANMRKVSIARPPLPEQRRIAEALRKMDEFIDLLEAVVAKKRNIKQGALQELLIGKKRLPGFTGKWGEAELGGAVFFCREVIPTAQTCLQWYVSTDNMRQNCGGVEANTSNVPYRYVREYRKGDILMSNIRPYLKKLWLADHDGGCSTDVHVLRAKDSSWSGAYLFQVLSQDKFFDYVMEGASGSKMPRGNRCHIAKYPLGKPTIAEQKAITKVLSDMDAEIAALEAKAEKLHGLKAGMMQELLTGQTRI